jgi:hypothetical protein
MGTLWMVTLLAQMVTQFFIGPYLDSIPRKQVMLFSEYVRLLSFTAVAGLLWFHERNVVVLYGAALLNSVVMYDPAANALLPATITKEQLVKATARITSGVQLIRFVALPIAGCSIGFLGEGLSLCITLILFIASVCLLRAIREDRIAPAKAPWLMQFRKGIFIYKQMPILLVLGFFIAVTNFGVTATQTMYIPYVRQILGASSFQYGMFAGCFPLGYMVGAALVSRRKEQFHGLYHMFGALLYGGISYILLSLTKNFSVALLIETSAGVFMPLWGVNSTALYQRFVPDDILAQVFAVRSLIARSATPIGALYATFATSHFSIPFLFWSVGALSCVTALFGLMLARFGYLQFSVTKKAASVTETAS